MASGSLVLHVMPYGNHVARKGKGLNFHRLWKPVGLQVRRLFVRDLESSVGLSPLCLECVQWLDRVNATRTALPGRCRAPGLAPSFWCLDRQDTRISPALSADLGRAVALHT